MKKPSAAVSATLISGVILLNLTVIPMAMARSHQTNVNVMSRNIYIGGDIFRVYEAATNPEAGPLEVPLAVAQLYEIIAYTNFAERAEAIAAEIRKNRPHLIGLQEVSTILRQSPGDFLLGNPQPATEILYDYLSILLAALKKRHLNYEVAVTNTNADVELPMLTGFTPKGDPVLDDLRLIDHDVILVRKDVKYRNTLAQNYTTNVSIPMGDLSLEFTRGFTALDAHIKNGVYRFVNTHLEVAGGPDYAFSAVQAAQMHELLTLLADEKKPVILVGDLNSDPDDGAFQSEIYGMIYPAYLQAILAGYLDIWTLQSKPAELTCCFNETVDDPYASLYERIDHILIHSIHGLKVEKSKVNATGDQVQDMTVNGLRPSDHAGLFGRIKFKLKH
jgi:endonuclease/exonuclease/phosphatase family metal-dependent hydrolase